MSEKTPEDGIHCPYCGQALRKWSNSTFTYSDGLGFPAHHLNVCFNDECSLYVRGWNSMFDNYGRVGSMRYWFNPHDGDSGALPVAHKDAMRGDIIEE
ncbi:MAG: hypothetical protein H7831_00595 [Magnetococcus sp. WYHC-3]